MEQNNVAAVPENEVPAEGANGVDRQPTRMESFFALTKSLIIRALVIYFITSFFRRPQATPPNQNEVTAGSKNPSWNYFENGTNFDMHVYVSEDYNFKSFNDPKSLAWFQDGLIYGDWV